MDSGTTAFPAAAGGAPSAAAEPKVQLPLAAIGWFLALLTVLYYPVLKIMVSEWFTDETMGHALFVPLTAAYLIWLDRERIMAAPVKRCWPALILVFWGFCQMLAGFMGAEFFTARTAFLIAAVGILWTIAGTAVLRTLVFPLFILLFMIRIPLYVFQQITFPLQLIASKAAAHGLEFVGIPVWREGNVMHVPGRDLEVVEACSGIRSLLSLTFLSVAYGRLFETRIWMRVALFASTIPIAIGCNAFRVMLTGVLTQWKPEIAEGAYHSFEGWVFFLVELLVLIGVHRVLRFASRSRA
jgi:exosortase